jgi:MerR family copper efflux transcriptional regulator
MDEAPSFHLEVRFRVKHFVTLWREHAMLIGELATASGLSREALRFYEQQGLIRARRLANGYRDYPPEVVTLVQYIRTAQQLGFTLAEIGDRLPMIWDAPEPGPLLNQVLASKLGEIDTRIAALQALRQTLAERVATDCPLHTRGLHTA